jgi:hypothetical protein
MTSQPDSNLIAFKAIANFTSELSELFAADQRSLKLYARLISKTTIAHEAPIAKHISAFRAFCFANRVGLIEKNSAKFVQHKVEYSDRVYMNIHDILKIADSETKTAIWKHLLLISALLDPGSKARDILAKEESNESNFLTDILGKVEGEFDPNASPMEAMSSIMSSGIFTDLISSMNSGLQDGSLDMAKLMGTVKSMVSTLGGGGADGVEGGDETMSMITNMLGNIPTGDVDMDSGGGAPINIMAMLGPMLAGMGGGVSGMGGGVSGMGGGGGGVEAVIEAQVAAAEESDNLPILPYSA